MEKLGTAHLLDTLKEESIFFCPSSPISGKIWHRHISLLQAKQALDRNHRNTHFCAIKQHYSECAFEGNVEIVWAQVKVYGRGWESDGHTT